MTKRYSPPGTWRASAVVGLLLLGSSVCVAQEQRREGGGAGPPDPPPEFRSSLPPVLDGPSVIGGQKPGIEVGDYAPDFQLQPIQPYAILNEWLGNDAPRSFEDTVTLSQLVGQRPVMLLFGSYT